MELAPEPKPTSRRAMHPAVPEEPVGNGGRTRRMAWLDSTPTRRERGASCASCAAVRGQYRGASFVAVNDRASETSLAVPGDVDPRIAPTSGRHAGCFASESAKRTGRRDGCGKGTKKRESTLHPCSRDYDDATKTSALPNDYASAPISV